MNDINRNRSCRINNCHELPIAFYGKRMEVMEWKCTVCNKESIAFYDLDLILDKDTWSEKLLSRFLQDPVFRALCVKYARFARLPFAQVLKSQHDPVPALLETYRMNSFVKPPDFASLYMFKNKVPGKKPVQKMQELLDAEGEALLYNDPMRLPGFCGFAGKNIPDPKMEAFKRRYYPLKENFYTLNRELLELFIDGFVTRENYEAAAILQKRMDMLPADWPDYRDCIADMTLERARKRESKREEYRKEQQQFRDLYREALEKPVPRIKNSAFRPYPFRVDDIFFYHDFDVYSGSFMKNEDKYYLADFGGYQIFKLHLKEMRKMINRYGHSHYLVRSKKDPGEYCCVYLLLENGDTVVNVFYHFNKYISMKNRLLLPIRKNHDVESFEWAIHHILKQLLPAHFNIDIRPEACEEE